MNSRSPIARATPRRLALGLIAAAFSASSCGSDPKPKAPGPLPDHRSMGFHGDRRKLGWVDYELGLPAKRITMGFGIDWESGPFDSATIDGKTYAPLVYASPLFARDVGVPDVGTADLVVAATNAGYVYGVVARSDADALKPGAFLFKQQLVTPMVVPKLDGGVPMGILSTPIIDVDANRLYVVGLDRDRGWLAFCLDLGDGTVLPGWPVALEANAISAVNGNPLALFPAPTEAAQRGALALSVSGDRLYVSFGTNFEGGPGWLVSIATAIEGGDATPRVIKSFSSAPLLEPQANGGLLGAGGPAVDPEGRVYVTTGRSRRGSLDAPKVWGNSLLVFSRDLKLEATYSPYNYCKLDDHDVDVGTSAPILIPNLSPAQTTTTLLTVFGSKNGTVYLLDRSQIPARTDKRPPCSESPDKDSSLLAPLPQPYLGGIGPLNVFGPFSDELGADDLGKMRSRPAYYRDVGGLHHVFVSGSYKSSIESPVAVPPSIVKVHMVLTPGRAAWLERSSVNSEVIMQDPGSPIVTGEGDDAVVWVQDSNALPSAQLLDPKTATPVLYAFAARDLSLLFRSADGDIRQAGRYVTPAIGNGRVFVASDKLTAFGPK